MIRSPRTTAVAAVALLTIGLGACSSTDEPAPAGSSSGKEPSDTSSTKSGATAETGFVPEDVADPGDDLLGGLRQGARFKGAPIEATWMFPTTFEPDAGKTTPAYSEDEHYRISILSGPGDQAEAAANLASAQQQAESQGQKTTLDTVTVADREFEVLVQDTPEAGIVTYAHAPDEGREFYLVQLASDMDLADVPKKQFDAFLQTVGSLEFGRP